ncbi:TRAP transporter small permease [Oceanispirochaeta sp.]|jgi:TRAP-type C4-dicarboxylate transport system permease small subunit|uniref:TRAP transporter small permease n=1 Tax=Oceanispirochaeta sp. TaxID=2035350 RepID=UPI0026258315|nr:TRAP transporter small permease [Oceanispirochaeta sp.]MDA3955105.1 TRAP transporter small permease [Oceanispirochaeta sp.]
MTTNSKLPRSLMKVMEGMYESINALCSALMTMQIIVITIVVFGRFVLNKSPAWGEGISLLCMVWFSMLSIAIGIRNENHIRITLLEQYLPSKWKNGIAIFNDLTIIAFAIFLCVEGFKVVELNKNWIDSAIGISKGWLYLSVPVGGILLAAMLSFKLIFEISTGISPKEARNA